MSHEPKWRPRVSVQVLALNFLADPAKSRLLAAILLNVQISRKKNSRAGRAEKNKKKTEEKTNLHSMCTEPCCTHTPKLSFRPHQVSSMFSVTARVPFRILDKKRKNRDESIDGCSGQHSLASMADQRLSVS